MRSSEANLHETPKRQILPPDLEPDTDIDEPLPRRRFERAPRVGSNADLRKSCRPRVDGTETVVSVSTRRAGMRGRRRVAFAVSAGGQIGQGAAKASPGGARRLAPGVRAFGAAMEGGPRGSCRHRVTGDDERALKRRPRNGEPRRRHIGRAFRAKGSPLPGRSPPAPAGTSRGGDVLRQLPQKRQTAPQAPPPRPPSH